jgi:hypothetical protein
MKLPDLTWISQLSNNSDFLVTLKTTSNIPDGSKCLRNISRLKIRKTNWTLKRQSQKSFTWIWRTREENWCQSNNKRRWDLKIRKKSCKNLRLVSVSTKAKQMMFLEDTVRKAAASILETFHFCKNRWWSRAWSTLTTLKRCLGYISK